MSNFCFYFQWHLLVARFLVGHIFGGVAWFAKELQWTTIEELGMRKG
jgi:hypothetical protein